MTRFRFRQQLIDDSLPGRCYAQTALADFDRDGIPEFVTGQQFGRFFAIGDGRMGAGHGSSWGKTHPPTSAPAFWTWMATAIATSSPVRWSTWPVMAGHAGTSRRIWTVWAGPGRNTSFSMPVRAGMKPWLAMLATTACRISSPNPGWQRQATHWAAKCSFCCLKIQVLTSAGPLLSLRRVSASLPGQTRRLECAARCPPGCESPRQNTPCPCR